MHTAEQPCSVDLSGASDRYIPTEETVEEYLRTISDGAHRARMREILDWVQRMFPFLQYETKWNQPVFLDHGTYIIGLSAARNHLSVSPETAGMERFSDEIREAGYSYTANLFRDEWNDPFPYDLVERVIAFNVEDKKDCWRS